MKKGANAPEKVLFKRVIKKRKKRAGKKSGPKFKWVTAPIERKKLSRWDKLKNKPSKMIKSLLGSQNE